MRDVFDGGDDSPLSCCIHGGATPLYGSIPLFLYKHIHYRQEIAVIDQLLRGGM